MNDSLTANKPEGKNYEPVPAGTHVATIFKIINLGHIKEDFQGQTKELHKIRIFWELPNKKRVFTVDGVDKELPLAISRKMTLSMGPKSNLRPFVVGMTGVNFLNDEDAYAFNIYSLLGHTSLINVTHKKIGDKTYANVVGAAPLIEGMSLPEQVNEPIILDVTKLTKEEIDALPEYIKKDMMSSSEYHVRFLAPRSIAPSVDDDYPEDINPDDIPF